MMKQTLIRSAVASALMISVVPAFAEDAPAAAPSPLAFNVGFVSDYLFRGISQTLGDPAIQGGLDYTFSNGAYVGAWGSTIKWVEGWTGDGNLEVDLYGGYRGSLNSAVNYDVGLITYLYPGKGDANVGLANPNTTELYGALTYKWFTAKYSHTISSHFVGFYGGPALDQETKGSGYLELNAAYDLGNGWGLTGHVGHQKVKDNSTALGIFGASYSDWKIGVTKDVGFGIVGLAYSDTDADGSCNSTPVSAYCWPENFDSSTITWSGPNNVADDQVVLTFTKTF